METRSQTSYLFLSKRKNIKNRKRMEQQDSRSDISVDSLEVEQKVLTNHVACMTKQQIYGQAKTVLVPFYEKDVLINLNTEIKKKQIIVSNKLIRNKKRKTPQEPTNYLINKKGIVKKTSYLEIFRKQLYKTDDDGADKPQKPRGDTSSLSPEVGDTQRSFEDIIDRDNGTPNNEFYETEAYNEMLYDKLLNMDLSDQENQLSDMGEREELERLQFENIVDKSGEDLRSVSEVSRPRPRRKHSSQPRPQIPVKIGGLGPDVESIRPRLERARSVQRYSDKVREENRLRIYKKPVEKETEQQAKKDKTLKDKDGKKIEYKDSYLQTLKNTQKRETSLDLSKHFKSKKKNSKEDIKTDEVKAEFNNATEKKVTAPRESRSRKKDRAESKAVYTGNKAKESKLPMQFSFLVNLGGRPNSALKRMEDKHRMFQEKIKTFKLSNEY